MGFKQLRQVGTNLKMQMKQKCKSLSNKMLSLLLTPFIFYHCLSFKQDYTTTSPANENVVTRMEESNN